MTEEEKARLTRQAVIEQAVKLADRDGLEAVTIRRLAEQLGVTPMALYWHVKNKDELLSAMADQLLAEVVPEGADRSPPDVPWEDGLRTMVVALIRLMRAHPCAPELLSTADKVKADSFIRTTEVALELLHRAGFSPQEAFLIASHLLHDIIGLVARAPDCPIHQDRQAMRDLPVDKRPRIVAVAAGADLDNDTYYAFGVDLLMGGVEQMARRQAIQR